MAHATIRISIGMGRCLADGVSAIVAGFAVSGNCAVVEDDGLKIIDNMT